MDLISTEQLEPLNFTQLCRLAEYTLFATDDSEYITLVRAMRQRNPKMALSIIIDRVLDWMTTEKIMADIQTVTADEPIIQSTLAGMRIQLGDNWDAGKYDNKKLSIMNLVELLIHMMGKRYNRLRNEIRADSSLSRKEKAEQLGELARDWRAMHQRMEKEIE